MYGNGKIMLARKGRELGAFSADDIRSGLVRGSFLPTDHFWYDGMADWGLLSDLFPELCAQPAPAPRAEPPPISAQPTIIINNTVTTAKEKPKSGGCSGACGLIVLFFVLMAFGAVLGPVGIVVALIIFVAIAASSR